MYGPDYFVAKAVMPSAPRSPEETRPSRAVEPLNPNGDHHERMETFTLEINASEAAMKS